MAPYENRKLTLADIYEVADKITTLYRNQGYLVGHDGPVASSTSWS
ncbi:hypothetical protein O4H55_19485 [Devosia neptuniae]|nr:POTRA domain-containing protein [Devosia neptuniae]MCZ4348207.1 hypothetical protein [Devosia neptuniae]